MRRVFHTIAVALLFGASSVAAKQEKTLVCHVGNEYGPGGEVYLDDPGCVPTDENDYFCPDAGKIDLIEVAKAEKHLNNPSHTFEYEPGLFVSDFEPDAEWVGRGNVDVDPMDGIDDGCQPEPPNSELLGCPCWNDLTESELAALLNSEEWTTPNCSGDSGAVGGVSDRFDQLPTLQANYVVNACYINTSEREVVLGGLSDSEVGTCISEIVSVIEQIDACQ